MENGELFFVTISRHFLTPGGLVIDVLFLSIVLMLNAFFCGDFAFLLPMV